jgi:hypothetical protein
MSLNKSKLMLKINKKMEEMKMGLFDIDEKEYTVCIEIVDNGYIVGVSKNLGENMEKVNVALDIDGAIKVAKNMLQEQKQKIKQKGEKK